MLKMIQNSGDIWKKNLRIDIQPLQPLSIQIKYLKISNTKGRFKNRAKNFPHLLHFQKIRTFLGMKILTTEVLLVMLHF